MWAVLMEVIFKARGFWEAVDLGYTERLEKRMAMEASSDHARKASAHKLRKEYLLL